jgi:hypothetical protein
MIHDFNNSIQVGSEGEEIILSYIKRLKSVKHAISVVDDPFYRAKDIDFVITTTSGEEITYELKTEPTANRTENFFYEYISNVSKNTVGCFLYSEADYWMSFIPQTGMLYVFPTEQCREYVLKKAKYLPLKNVRNTGKLTQGKVINIDEVCENVKHNARNIRDYVDYEYVEGTPETDTSPAIPSKFLNVKWKSQVP